MFVSPSFPWQYGGFQQLSCLEKPIFLYLYVLLYCGASPQEYSYRAMKSLTQLIFLINWKIREGVSFLFLYKTYAKGTNTAWPIPAAPKPMAT